MMANDFENPFGLKTPKGELKMMSNVLDMGVFPGTQGGPLEHVIAAKAIAFQEALSDDYLEYAKQVKRNAAVMAKASGIATTPSVPSKMVIRAARPANCTLLVRRGVRVSRRAIRPRVITSVLT